jgi:hypothetical protein
MTYSSLSRRVFMQQAAAAGAVVMGMPAFARPRHADTKLRVLSIGVIGTIGGADRRHRLAPLASTSSACAMSMPNALAEAADHPKRLHLRRLPRSLRQARRQVRRGHRRDARPLALQRS